MELTQQMATVQDEVKLLKGEIKTILRELRTAVLSQDNPFATDASPPAFQPVARPASEEPGAQPADPDAEEETTELPVELPAMPFDGPAPSPIAAPAASAPQSAAGPGGAIGAPLPTPEPQPPTPIHPEAEGDAQPGEPPAKRWNLLTIASLTAWAEDSLAALGSKRYQLVLELATFAGLVSQDVRDVLSRLDQAESPEKDEGRSMNINECLVVLRQLEAILDGEKVTKLPRRRVRRSRSRPR